MSRGRNMRWYGSLGKEKVIKNLKESGSQRGIRGKNLLDKGFHGGTDLTFGRELIVVIADTPFYRISSRLKRANLTHLYISFTSFVWNGGLPIIRV